jgi:2-aminoadipate transaminase
VLAPGFRLAWLVAPPEALAPIVRAKQAGDLHTSSFVQLVALEACREGFMDAQLARTRDYYRQQRDRMLAALERHFPEEAHWTRPKGGMFLWVTLPEGLNATELAREAAEAGVVYVPGEAFFAGGGGENTLRLSYSVATPEQIETGMRALGEVFSRQLATV